MLDIYPSTYQHLSEPMLAFCLQKLMMPMLVGTQGHTDSLLCILSYHLICQHCF